MFAIKTGLSEIIAVPLVQATEGFWTGARLAGALIVGGFVMLLALSLPYHLLRGDLRATEAMFRDIDFAVGNVRSLQVSSVGQGAWTILVLAGFILLGLDLIEQGSTVLPVLAMVAFAIFTTAMIFESSFHLGVTAWAARQVEMQQPVPELFHQLKTWLNVYVQLMVNPLAFLSFIAFAIASLATGLLPAWSAWIIIIWSGVWLFIPFPLALYPVPIFMGTILLVYG